MSIIKYFCLKGTLLHKMKIKLLLYNNMAPYVSFASSYYFNIFPEVAKVLDSINKQNNSDCLILDYMQKAHLI